MYDIFKTVLILSLFGFGITALLLLLKPITAKRLPARWQYCVWVAVLISMLFPAYKLIPKKEAQKLSIVPQNQTVQTETQPQEEINPDTVVTYDTPIEYREVNLSSKIQIRLFDLIAYIWGTGVLIFSLVVIISYFRFLCHKNKNAIKISDNKIFSEVKKELKIKRRIRLKASSDIGSPMLVGILFPTVYIPCREIPDDNMRMVLLHELTHYKRKDLLMKWFAVLVNAVHWFNPLCYLACAALSEACEVSCDMSVTKNMSEDEQKLYMQTILNLVEERS
ncbi:MAG: M56 family metallopeptidase [Clostridia bacterium]|nr:M56 family metallopeptidase [Clostridia bacterium]